MTGAFAATAAATSPATAAGPLFFGPLTPILRFLLPLVLLAAVVYVIYKVLT